MVGELYIFESIEMLEPKCPKCLSKIDYGVSTKFHPRLKAHVCIKCGKILK